MIKINDYLPKVLQDVEEFKAINSNLDIELTNIDTFIKGIQTEAIVQTATEYGISKWEKTLGIIPMNNESLDVRRFRVNNILTSKLPYTLRWLQNKLTEIVGSDSGWTLNINYQDYTITIILSGLDTNLMLEVQKQLRNAVPANMGLEIGGPSIAGGDVRIGIGLMYGTKYLIETVGVGASRFALGKNKWTANLIKRFTVDYYYYETDRKIAVKPNTTYIFSSPDSGVVFAGNVQFSDNYEGVDFIDQIFTFDKPFTTPSYCKAIRVLFNEKHYPEGARIQLELGETKTSYEEPNILEL